MYGKCFRFNSGINIYNQTCDLFNSKLSGRLNGLRIDFHDLTNNNDYDFNELLINKHNDLDIISNSLKSLITCHV